MAAKIGSSDVSFRLGAATPAAVAIGSVQVWTDVVPTVPGIPTGLTVTTSETAESSVDVSWTAPESDGDSPITGYKVYRSFDGSTYTLHSSPSGTSAAVTVAYNGGQTIYVRVSAVNAIGEGSYSEVTTGTLSDSAPGAPESVQMVVNGVRTLSLQWSPPSVDGGEAITGYTIYYSNTSGGSTVYTETVGPEVNDYTFDASGESAGYQYSATVAATNSIGTGPQSGIVYGTTADAPSSPSFMSAAAAGYEAGGIDIGFSAPGNGGSAITQYDLEYDTGDFFSTASSQTISAEVTSHTLTGLQGGQAYYLRLRAVNAAGASEWSVFASNPVAASATAPGVPTGFTVTPNYTNAEWDATWTEPSDGGSVITSYEIEEVDIDYSDLNTASLSGTGSAVSWAVNDPDQTRYFRIRAVNAVGNGEWSEYVESYYDTPTVPGAPTINTATYDGSVTYIAYSPPGDDGNAAITAYTFYFDGVAVSPDSTGAGDATFNSDYTGQDATVTATNSVGEGAASAAVEVTTA